MGAKSRLIAAGASSVIVAADVIEAFRGSLKGDNSDGRMSREMADAIREFCSAPTASDAISSLAETFQGLHADLGKAEDDIFYVDPPFLHLSDYATRYGSDYERFLDDIEAAKAQLAYVPPFEDDGANAPVELWRRPLHLMTALRAKGKEFGTVILLDANDGIWPSKHAKTPQEHEAERRLFYVAFTRARERVLIQVAQRIGGREATPSPFLRELGLGQ
ncbi:3'-5' exonuclease [Sorangium sp. So ce834]|uniref:3'-5' exonuclease n=1 Tax=Sorangium sp. So ce834 TaxID=3133321 RepID=UPI003F5E2894